MGCEKKSGVGEAHGKNPWLLNRTGDWPKRRKRGDSSGERGIRVKKKSGKEKRTRDFGRKDEKNRGKKRTKPNLNRNTFPTLDSLGLPGRDDEEDARRKNMYEEVWIES